MGVKVLLTTKGKGNKKNESRSTQGDSLLISIVSTGNPHFMNKIKDLVLLKFSL